jgi:hypothetical protein
MSPLRSSFRVFALSIVIGVPGTANAQITVERAKLQPTRCEDGKFQGSIRLSARPRGLEVEVTPKDDAPNNVIVVDKDWKTFKFSDESAQGFEGNLKDVCKAGDFIFSLTGSIPVINNKQTVTVPAVGAKFPDKDGIPNTRGTPKRFELTFNLENCLNVPAVFNIATEPIVNILGRPRVVGGPAVLVAGGAKQPITIRGNKDKPEERGAFLVKITPPGPAGLCESVVQVKNESDD